MDVLTKEDKDRIVAALADVEVLRKELAKAQRAGIDVTALRTELAAAETKLKSIKRVYID